MKIPENIINTLKKLQQQYSQTVSGKTLDKFCTVISNMSGWETLRMNPIAFSDIYSLPTEEVIALFICCSKAGLFSFEWDLLCPLCGGREHSYHSLNQLAKKSYHCTLCDKDVSVEADNHLEVSFCIPEYISGFTPMIYDSMENYWNYYFSPALVWSAEICDLMKQQPPMQFVSLQPGEKKTVTLPLTPTATYRVSSLDTHSIYRLSLENITPKQSIVSIIHTDQGFIKEHESVPGNSAELSIENRSERSIGCLIGSPDSAMIEKTYTLYPAVFKPFLNGKMILNNQIFRELFLVDNLPDDLSLKINDLTLLFTDLKGSTELYEKTGDEHAYQLVQNHFKILQNIVRQYHGGIVKTMGDAIMASFCHPIDGVKAGFSMLKEINEYNKTLAESDRAIGLKIGIHRGNVIAVKANQTLDYFGQTVNITARVQNLAGSQQIWMTNDIMRDKSVKKYIADSGCSLQSQSASLKGVKNQIQTHMCNLS